MNKTKPSVFSANMIFFLFLAIGSTFFSFFFSIPGMAELTEGSLGNSILLIFNEVVFMAGIPLAYLLITRRNIGTVTRLSQPISFGQIGIILAMLAVTFLLIGPLDAIWGYVLKAIGYKTQELNLPVPEDTLSLVMCTLSVGIAPAFCEEFAYRGVVLRGYEHGSKVTAVVMSSLLFALMHSTLEQLFYALVVGIIMGYIVVVCDSLWGSILFHFLFNMRSVLAMYMIHQDPSLLEEVAAETTLMEPRVILAMVTTLLPILVLLMLALYFISRKRKKLHTESRPTVRNGFVGYIPFILGTGIVLLEYLGAYLL